MPYYNFNFRLLFLLSVAQPLERLIYIYYVQIHKEFSFSIMSLLQSDFSQCTAVTGLCRRDQSPNNRFLTVSLPATCPTQILTVHVCFMATKQTEGKCQVLSLRYSPAIAWHFSRIAVYEMHNFSSGTQLPFS